MATAAQLRFMDAIDRNLRGVHFFSVGTCPGCEECPEYDEGTFSRSPCDSCGSTLAGNRYSAHGVIAANMRDTQGEDAEITHFDICEDCLFFHASGDLPGE